MFLAQSLQFAASVEKIGRRSRRPFGGGVRRVVRRMLRRPLQLQSPDPRRCFRYSGRGLAPSRDQKASKASKRWSKVVKQLGESTNRSAGFCLLPANAIASGEGKTQAGNHQHGKNQGPNVRQRSQRDPKGRSQQQCYCF